MNPPAAWRIFRGRSPYEPPKPKVGVPDNAIVKFFQSKLGFIILMDWAATGVLITRFILVLFVPTFGLALQNWGYHLIEWLPAVLVGQTGIAAIMLIGAKNANTQIALADAATIRDKPAREERQAMLRSQLKASEEQQKRSRNLLLFYVGVLASAHLFGIDPSSLAGQIATLVILVLETSVPLYNIQTFSTVEAATNNPDTIANGAYEANMAVMHLLQGVADRVRGGRPSQQDFSMLRKMRAGKIDSALSRRVDNSQPPLAGEHYVSLRFHVTKKYPGQDLTDDEQKRYDRALAVVRSIRRQADTNADKETLAHFQRDPSGGWLVSSKVLGAIVERMNTKRTRKPRTPKVTEQATVSEPTTSLTQNASKPTEETPAEIRVEGNLGINPA